MEHARAWKTEELLQQHRWARSLARHLVADEATADDITQEAMIIALDKAPTEGRNSGLVRSWLGTVVRNVARQKGRSEVRRAHRERESATQESLPSALEMTAFAEGQELLLKALLTLDEESRHMVLLRYQEGLSAAEIARRLGKNPGSVRSKISRALGRLRAELDEVHGGDRHAWHAAVAPLVVGAPRRAVAASSAISLVGAAVGLVVVAAAASVALLTPDLITTSAKDAPSVLLAPLERAYSSIDSDEEQPLAPVTPDEPLDRTAAAETVDSPPPAAARPSESKIGRVRLRVLDQEAQPIAGVQISYGSREPTLSAADGRVEVEVFFARPSGQASLSLVHSGHAADVVSVLGTPGETVDAGDHVLRPGGDIHGRVLDSQGNPLPGMLVSTRGLGRQVSSGGGLTAVQLTPLGQTSATTDPNGQFELHGVLAGEVDVSVESKNRLWTGSASSVKVAPGTTVRDLVITAIEAPLNTRIEGVVFDHLGKPAPYASIRMKWRRFFTKHSRLMSADAEGRFAAVVSPNASVDMWICAIGDPQPLAVRSKVDAGSTDLSIRLAKPRTLTVLISEDNGTPIPNAKVSTVLEDSNKTLSTTDADGRAEMSRPIGDFTLIARAEGFADLSKSFRELPTDRSDAEVLPIQLVKVPQLQGVVRNAEGAPVEAATLSVRPVAKYRTTIEGLPSLVDSSVAASTRSNQQGIFALTLRDPGDFILRAESEGYAPAEFGPFRYDPKRGLAGVSMALLQGGTVEGRVIDGDQVRQSHVVMLARGDGVVRTVRTDLDGLYRFAHVPSGPCMLRVVPEMLPTGVGASSSTLGTPFKHIEGDVLVQEQAVARFDLLTGNGLPPVTLQGKLNFMGFDPARFRVTLVPEEDSQDSANENQPQRVRSDGAFELRSHRPGGYTLQFIDTGAEDKADALYLVAPIDLAVGANRWSLECVFGPVTVGVGASPAAEKLLWRGPAGAFATRSLPAVGKTCAFPSGTIMRVATLDMLKLGSLMELDQLEPLESIHTAAGAQVTVGQ